MRRPSILAVAVGTTTVLGAALAAPSFADSATDTTALRDAVTTSTR